LYECKGRPGDVPIAVLVASLDQALNLVEPPAPHVRRVAERFWPGALTLVLRRREAAGVATGDNVGPGSTVGIRCPDHEFVRALAARIGPIATTSANRHGEPTPATAAAAAASLLARVDLVVDGGACAGVASTVVDTTGPELRVLRVGPISEEQVRDAAIG
jgi:tRNA threonylcarbamoyl adenosine modification protein (Sua5/YciO/YrdC/YwlC family)